MPQQLPHWLGDWPLRNPKWPSHKWLIYRPQRPAAKNALDPNRGARFCFKVTVTFTLAKRGIYLVMSAPSGGGDCKLLWGKSFGCWHSWQFMQKCSKRILLRLGMWADDERRETFERLTPHSRWIRLWTSSTAENKKISEFVYNYVGKQQEQETKAGHRHLQLLSLALTSFDFFPQLLRHLAHFPIYCE